MNRTVPNIEFKKPNKNPTITSEGSLYDIPFYKDDEFFASFENYVKFVKAVEQTVRTSVYYSRYISILKKEYGLTACQVLSNIDPEEDEKTVIEMHHGPILTLFDYASIITDYLLVNNKKINSFIVADILLEEHFNNNVQVVMLSKTIHQQVHENNIFINYKQGFGDLPAFLKKYYDGLDNPQIMKINDYIEKSSKYDSTDNGVLKVASVIANWSN